MIEPARLSLARLPTPLVPLDRLSEAVGGPRIWLKRDDLTEMTASGNKLRKLEFSVAQAEQEGASVLITCGGIQSNHCRATATIAAQRGLKCQLLLRGRPETGPADGNLLLDELLGANVRFVTGAEWDELDRLFEETASQWRDQGETPFSIPTGASDEIGMWGYISASAELKRDFETAGIEPGAIISATGSGGTQAGLIVGRQLESIDAAVMAFNVCDDEAWFREKIAADTKRWEQRYEHRLDWNDLAINVIDGYVGPGYGRADAHVFETIRRVAALEGVIFDPVYTGKAFDALLTEIGKGRFDDTSDVVFIHTGGLFGLFPSRANL